MARSLWKAGPHKDERCQREAIGTRTNKSYNECGMDFDRPMVAILAVAKCYDVQPTND